MNFSTILLERISHHLLRRGETISIFEQVTSGALQLAFSQMPDAHNFYNGGLTIFNHSQINWLNLPMNSDQILESRNGAERLSIEVAKQFGSDWSIAITGSLSSKEEFYNQIFAYYSISYKNVIIRSDKIDLHPLTKAWDAQKYFAEYVLTPTGMEI
ncbi:CinA family protein [Epilithonimonas hominis]|uniref:Damage-inducible protein CinA n=1 Tax=Epilithonimonas hominis TaxID=420404 RepID=A0A3N0XBG4_9FLAO|nr:CinA family protein [Epilithonimonas hominis]ROI14653.1 damage-inducible protein CinA [Epilithonimonas hominis]